MNCLPITSGYNRNQCSGQAGVYEFYINNFDKEDTFIEDGNEIVGTFSFAGATNSYFRIEQANETGIFSETIDKPNGRGAGPAQYIQTIEFTLHNITPEDRLLIKKIKDGTFRMVVRDMNGAYRIAGYNNGMSQTAMEFSTTDLNCKVTLTGNEKYSAPFVDEAGFLSVISA